MIPHDIPQFSILRRDDYENSKERIVYLGDGYTRSTFSARYLYDRQGSPVNDDSATQELRVMWVPTGDIYSPQ